MLPCFVFFACSGSVSAKCLFVILVLFVFAGIFLAWLISNPIEDAPVFSGGVVA